jgi:hypothetical protein
LTGPTGETWRLPHNSPYTGQAGVAHRSDRSKPESPKIPNRPTELQNDPTSKQQQHGTTMNTPKRSPEQNPTRFAPVRPVKGTGQTDVAWASRDEQHQRVNTPRSNSRSPESLHGFVQDFGDSRNTSWEVHSQPYVHQNLPNQEESKKYRKPQNRAPLLTDLGGELKGKEPQRGTHTPPPNPQKKGLENCHSQF